MQTFLKQARLRALSGTRRTHQHNYFCHMGIRLAVRVNVLQYPGNLRNCASPVALQSAPPCPSRHTRSTKEETSLARSKSRHARVKISGRTSPGTNAGHNPAVLAQVVSYFFN